MDLQKIQIRQDLERMVLNYFLMGKINEDQSTNIIDHIDRIIGGGFIPTPGPKGEIILFPGVYEGTPAQAKKETSGQSYEIDAPYGTDLPEGFQDFRPVLQRDGLILICWEKHTSKEGAFFNILWAKSSGKGRNTCWSGFVREEEIPYIMPDDVEYSYTYRDKLQKVYTVKVAPDDVLQGAFSDFPKYVQSLKDFGITVNFDYDFNYASEKRNRFLEKNKELIPLNLPPRILNVLNAMEIFTVEGA
jgi:hypothetical protein